MRPADVVLHPQRLPILRALAAGPLTTKQIAARLPEIRHATLYRHLALLLEAGVITVASERQVRGTPERTYALGGRTVLTREDLGGASREDHFRYFTIFVAGLLGEYGKYLERPVVDLERDGVGYRETVLNLTEVELTEMLVELRQVISRRMGNAPSPERSPHLFSTIIMPVDAPAETDA